MQRSRTLKYHYNRFNKKFFHGTLPNIPLYFVSQTELKRKGLGKRTCAVTLIEDGRPVAILIERNAGKGWSYILSDLIHEIIHVAHPRASHGPVFKAELKRLFRAGAFNNIL